MTPNERWNNWQTLPSEAQELLELVSLVYAPKPKTDLLRLFDGYRSSLSESARNMEGWVPVLRAKGGWSSGRLVPSADLKYKTTGMLTGQDEKVILALESATSDGYGYYRGTPVLKGRILRELENHPHLFDPDGGHLRLSRDEPCFEVQEKSDTLHLRLTPPTEGRADYGLRKIEGHQYAVVVHHKCHEGCTSRATRCSCTRDGRWGYPSGLFRIHQGTSLSQVQLLGTSVRVGVTLKVRQTPLGESATR